MKAERTIAVTAQRVLVLLFSVFAMGLYVGCGGGGTGSSGNNAITVSAAHSGTATVIEAGSPPVTLTASVTNDSTNAGVTWSLSPASGCGSLSASGTTATYTPPSESSLNANCSASIAATSVANGSKTATSTFTVQAVAINLPNGESTAPTTAAGEAALPLSATIANDFSGSAALNWSISGSSSGAQHATTSRPVLQNVSAKASAIMRGQQTSSCGTLSDSGSTSGTNVSGNSVTYTPPSSGPCTATITVSTSVNPNVFTTFSVTVNAPLSITTSALNAGTYGTNYSATLAATGGVGPYTWTANGGSLPPGLTLTPAGVLSGTPTATGNYNLVVTATDANSYAVQLKQPLPLSVSKALLLVAANNASMTYGATVPTFSANYTGWINNDTQSVLSGSASLTTSATSSSVPGNYTITAAAGTLTAANYTFSFVNGSLTVNPKALTVTGLSASSKAYDGTTAATLSLGSATLNGVVGSDNVALSPSGYTATFAGKNVGASVGVTVSGLSLSGPAAGNYTLTQPTGVTGAITPRPITVTAGTATKPYDGLLASNGQPTITVGSLATGDTAAWSETYDNKNVGTTHVMTPTGTVSDGNNGNDYAVTFSPINTGIITARPITVTAFGSSKPYDGTASSNGVPAITSGSLVSGDTASWSQTYDNASVGTTHVMTPAGTVSDGNGGANYTITFATVNTGVITAKALTVTGLSANSKAYDGTTTATLNLGTAALTGLVGSDSVTLSPSGYTATFAGKNVGTSVGVTVSGLSLSGPSAGNYTLTQPTGVTGAITQRPITVTAGTATKPYDGLLTSNGQPAITVGSLATGDTGAWSETYDNKNVGTAHVMTPTGTVSDGNSGNNYLVTFATANTGIITPRPITVTAVGSSKPYDGTTSSSGVPTITSGSLVSGDTASWTQTYDNASVGTTHVMTAAGTVSDGNGGANYTVSFATVNTGVITAKALTVTGLTANSKAYDGTTTASLNLGTAALNGLVGTDSVVLSPSGYTATFAGKNVGTSVGVTVSGLSLSGPAAGNYTLTQPTGVTGAITPRPITVTAGTATKPYDGLLTSNGQPSITSGSLATGDTGAWSETYDNKNVGTTHVMTPTGTVSDGNSGNNYVVTFSPINTGTITARPITVKAVGSSKPYDGTTSSNGVPTVTSGSLVSGDTASWTQTYDNAGVGTTHVMTPAGTVSDGNGGANYVVTFATVNTGVITAKSLTVTGLSANSKAYDGTPTASLNLGTAVLNGLVGSDSVSLSPSGYTATFAGKNVGASVAVTVSGLSLSGPAAGNYTLTQPTGVTGTITPRPITVTAGGSSKPYDGMISSSGAPSITSGSLVTGDTGTWSETYDNKNVGMAHVMTPTGTVSDGNNGNNYAVTFSPINTGIITPVTLTVTADNKTMTVGGSLPTFTATETGFVNAENAAIALTGAPAFSTTTTGNTQGTFPITVTQGTLQANYGNYTFNFVNGTLTVNQQISVTLSPRGTTNLDAGATLPITVTVANDPATQGANFSLNPATGCGTLSGGGTSNVFSVTYNAPTSLSSQCQVTVTAAAYSNNSQTDQLTITVYPVLSIPSTTLPSVYVGQLYNGSVNLQGGTPSYTWNASVASGSLPAGLSLSNLNGSTLQITGKPATPSGCSTYPPSCTYTFTVKVTDGTGAVATSPTLSITVNQVQPLTLPTSQPTSLPSSGIVNSSYNGNINVSGGVPPYTFTVNSTSVTTTNGTPIALTDGLNAWNGGGNSLGIGGTLGSAPTTVPLSVSVQDSASPSHTAGPIQYSIVVSNPTPLAFASDEQSQIINYGGVGLPYTTYFNVTGGSGNPSNYVFTTINGTSLPPGLQWSTTCHGCVVGTPTTASPNPYSFTVQVTDSVTQQTASGTYQITISAAPNGANNQYLYGHYAFEFQGVVDNPSGQGELYQTAAVGSFYADGNGNITGGVVDITDGSTPGVGNKIPFAGTYSIGADNRGILTLCTQSTYGQPLGTCQTQWLTSNIANPSALNNYFIFSVGSILDINVASGGGTCTSGPSSSACPLYTDGFIIEADDAGPTPSTIHGGGRLLRQSRSEFDSLTGFNTNIAGSWVFGVQGEDTSSNPVASGGILSLATGIELTSGSNTGNYQGNITGGTVDVNDNNTNLTNTVNLTVPSSGSYWQTAGSSPAGSWTTNNGRFKVNLSVTNAPTAYPTSYIGYMINANQLLLLSTQPHNGTSTACGSGPCLLLSGRGFKQQQASYGDSNVNGPYVTYMYGYNDAQLMQSSCTNGACTLNTNIENRAGTVYTNQWGGSTGSPLPTGGLSLGTATITSTGRMTFGDPTSSGSGNVPAIFYLYDTGISNPPTGYNVQGGLALGTNNVVHGYVKPQGSVPSSLIMSPVSYYMGSLIDLNVASSHFNDSGSFSTDTSGNATGYSDDAGQGGSDWGDPITGITMAAPNTYGVFNLQSTNWIASCYFIYPIATGTPFADSFGVTYATYACIGNDNDSKIMMMKQVQ